MLSHIRRTRTRTRRALTLPALAALLAAAFLLAGGLGGPGAPGSPGGGPPAVSAQAGTIDYDADDDRFIDISTPDQLQALHYDLNGDGLAPTDANAYNAAFPMRDDAGSDAMGCPSTCQGYELVNDLDMSSIASFTPIAHVAGRGNFYSSQFHGRGYVIRNLTISNGTNSTGTGLFARTNGATITGVGLVNVDIQHTFGSTRLGALVGLTDNTTIRYSYVNGGRVRTTHSVSNDAIGGLVGYADGGTTIAASYANVGITTANASQYVFIGGLVGHTRDDADISASYAAGSIVKLGTIDNDDTRIGGLVGWMRQNTDSATTSYSTTVVDTGGTAGTRVGGFIGYLQNSGAITDSYWDSDVSGPTGGGENVAAGASQTTSALQTPTEYGATGLYSNWNINVDGDASNGPAMDGNDDPWDFGNDDAYPAIRFQFDAATGDNDGATERETYANQLQIPKDYDTDDDDLIEVDSLAKLDAIRHDADGNGLALGAGHSSGFPNPMPGMGCDAADTTPGECKGYELTADLDFDSNGDGVVNSSDRFNGSWTPISSYSGEFQGHGHTLRNLRINNTGLTRAGLFGVLTDGALVENLGLLNVDIYTIFQEQNGSVFIGALAGGSRRSVIRSVYATGRVRGLYDSTGSSRAGLYFAGGLLGELEPGTTTQPSSVITSWANVRVSTHNQTSANNTPDRAGGLIGFISAAGASPAASSVVLASYALGEVTVRRDLGHATERCRVGGFVGHAAVSTIIASYSIGNPYCPNTISAAVQRGGFIGHADNVAGSTFTNNYWDQEHANLTTGSGATGQTNSALVSPTDYGTQATDIYMNWNIDLDNADTDNDYATGEDNPWDFVDADNYPILRYEYGTDADANAREAAARAIQIGVSYDSDNDDLIEIRTLAQLNAIRWDLDGNGVVVANRPDYEAAFPRAAAGMGCDGGYGNCDGYELAADLDFDTDGDGVADAPYASWTPIGPGGANSFTATFQGNGYTISNLTIDSSTLTALGLFGGVNGATFDQVGLPQVRIRSTYSNSSAAGLEIGALAAYFSSAGGAAAVRNSYSTGTIAIASSVSGNQVHVQAGGLLGDVNRDAANAVAITANWSDVAITLTTNSGYNNDHDRVGGLIGFLHAAGGVLADVTASYATGDVHVTLSHSTTTRDCRAGGLIGEAWRGNITASYASGAPTCDTAATGSAESAGGLIGYANPAAATVTNSYWDETTGIATGVGAGTPTLTGAAGQTTTALQSPTAYGDTTPPASIYAAWNVNTDGNTATGTPTVGGDDPWDFVDADNYPILRYEYGSDAPATAREERVRTFQIPTDYDPDNDDRINITTLAQLDAIRYDLDSDGVPADPAGYAAAFPRARNDRGCTTADTTPRRCSGYELAADLDFDTNDDGMVDGSDAYPSWTPIGSGGAAANAYTGIFDGNGHTISNLTIDSENVYQVGLFGTAWGATIENVGLLAANITPELTASAAANAEVGTLVGIAAGGAVIRSSYATGAISATGANGAQVFFWTGGLVGEIAQANTAIAASWADVAVRTTSSGTHVNQDLLGGLVGLHQGPARITASYAAGNSAAVRTGNNRGCKVGGLIGQTSTSGAAVTASYSTGTVDCSPGPSGTDYEGGLIGHAVAGTTFPDTYWDTTASGTTTGVGELASGVTAPTGQTTAALGAPTGYAGIYADWNRNVDGAAGNDDPWDFGARGQYPILKFGYNDFGRRMQRSPHDTDGDGLLEVDSLTRLDAIRLDLAGAGDTFVMPAADRTAYQTAFPGHLRCAPAACIGYELTANLDFAGSQWATAPGWTPIGVNAAGAATPYTGDFNGNHHTISNLLIELTTSTADGGSDVGLFGQISGTVRNLTLDTPNITNTRSGGGLLVSASTGALAGETLLAGTVDRVTVSGGTVTLTQTASDTTNYVGCLLGDARGVVTNSAASCAVTAADSSANGSIGIGGLIGYATANITGSHAAGAVAVSGAAHANAGGLVGQTDVNITSSYATGAVNSTSSDTDSTAGGLAGLLTTGDIKSAFATGAVTAADAGLVGGLLGNALLGTSNVIEAAYATGAVSRTSATGGGNVGGLIGSVDADTGTSGVTAAYAIGAVSNDDTTTPGVAGGLVANVVTGSGQNSTPVTDSYWNNEPTADGGTGQSMSAGGGSGFTASDLRTPIDYTTVVQSIAFYGNWNLDLDAVSGNDDPWDFGTATDYPILTYGHDLRSLRAQRPLAVTTDYDVDDDGLIDIGGGGVGNLAALHQLNALRHDAAGTGETGLRGSTLTAYLTAFPATMVGMGCPATCTGYELAANLDFDDTGDGTVDTSDEYDNWTPLPNYNAAFAGDGYIISRLTINANTLDNAGLFGATGPDAVITGVGLDAVSVDGQHYVGALAGTLRGTASASWSAGAVAGDHTVGGLVGRIGSPSDPNGALTAGYSRASVTARAGTATVGGGGLVGSLYGALNYGYAAGPVSVAGAGTTRGLIGITESGSAVTASYWDTNNSGVADDNDADTPEGLTVDAIQAPAAYAGTIYAAWNVDVDNADGDGDLTTGADDPWDFGATLEYPVLKYGAGANAANLLAQRPIDYDRDGDDLIEIRTPAQLDAVRYDLDGSGRDGITGADLVAYNAAFPNAVPGDQMGCNNTVCIGYELVADIDLSSYANWVPLGSYNSAGSVTFDGNGHTISNLTITDSAATDNQVGLFSSLDNNAVVESVGLVNVNIADSAAGAGQHRVGALSGQLIGTVRYSYATGTITATSGGTLATFAGGLIGRTFGGTISASWADVDVTVTSTSTNTTLSDQVGGLTGQALNGTVIASFAKGDVTSDRDRALVGGLIGNLTTFSGSSTLTAGYSIGQPTATGGGANAVAGGLIAAAGNTNVTINPSYWDTITAMTTASPGGGTGQTTMQLQTPDGYTGIYAANWNVNVDGNLSTGTPTNGYDNPWHFGTGTQYPTLVFNHDIGSIRLQRGEMATTDYDLDDDNLIDIGNGGNVAGLHQLNALRLDRNGSGEDGITGRDAATYLSAFPGLSAGMGCPDGCRGYELTANLDFDDDGNGTVASPDRYRNWTPIPVYQGEFQGNGHTIANLTITDDAGIVREGINFHVGLFGRLGGSSLVEGLGLTRVNIDTTYNASNAVNHRTGALAGRLEGVVRSTYARGTVTANITSASTSVALTGGLVGASCRTVAASWADVDVTVASAANQPGFRDSVGGLVGSVNDCSSTTGEIIASYARGAVTADRNYAVVGGLVGVIANPGRIWPVNIVSSYATGPATATGTGTNRIAAGLVGWVWTGVGIQPNITNSYWEITATNPADPSASGEGKTRAELQATIGYTTGGIYENWNANVDGQPGPDDPWDFGTADQYPVLKYGYNADGISAQRPVDYDADGDDLIEISTPAQLNAIRFDRNGDGQPASSQADYQAAFPNAMRFMGCTTADTSANECSGYELTADLDLAGSAYSDWAPIDSLGEAAQTRTVTLRGNGYAIRNLRITDTSAGGFFSVGLFRTLNPTAVVESLALLDVDIVDSYNSASDTFYSVGALAGFSRGQVRYSYATGRVQTTATGGASAGPISRVGGLVGSMSSNGVVAGSWADVAVTVESTSGNSAQDSVGGLVGRLYGDTGSVSTITAAYAKGNVSANRGTPEVGGLVGTVAVGTAATDASVIASYSIGVPSAASPATDTGVGGLVGANAGTITNSYFDFTINSGLTQGTTGQTTMALQTPEAYGTQSTDIYMNWNVNVDGDTMTGTPTVGGDDPWHFGGAMDYPILQFGYNAANISRQMGVEPTNDYDLDDDGLIDIDNLAQLNAIRYDLDGDGNTSGAATANYLAGFAGPLTGMGCPADTCTGYELVENLYFDTNEDGMVDVNDAPLAWGGGSGWAPIGDAADNRYNAVFDGNGHTIEDLFINRGAVPQAGLFGYTGPDSRLTRIGLPDVNVTGNNNAGALAGEVRGRVSFSWVTGQVTAVGTSGMLVGINYGPVASSWSAGQMTGSSAGIGGLVGRAAGPVVASYSHARVQASDVAGGLVGQAVTGNASITASYAAGRTTISSGSDRGGLLGGGAFGFNSVTGIVSSYYDSATTTVTGGETTANLRGTLGYSGIYETWDDHDVDGDLAATPDSPWDFLTAAEYPILRYGHSPTSIALQRAMQDAGLRTVAGTNVERIRQTAATAYTLEIQPLITSVELTLTPNNADAVAAVDRVAHIGTRPDPDWLSGAVIPLTPAGTEGITNVRVLVTAPNGVNEQEYWLSIQRIFCPKAEVNGPTGVVGEGGSADFTVLVCGMTTEPVIVSWAVVTEATPGVPASTATADDVDSAFTGTITVPAGDDRTATLSFPITDDTEPESSETLIVIITAVSGGTDRIERRHATATIALSDPKLNLRAPEGTGAGGANAGQDTELTPQSMLVLMEGADNTYTMQMSSNPRESITVVIHSNHASITTTPDRVTFNANNYNRPQRITINAAPDGDDKNERATLTHILTDDEGGLIEIIDQIPLFVADTDPPEDDDIC